MDKDQNIPEPTKGELEILQVLWKHGPSPVRFVNEQLNENRPVKYTSTLKQMQLMAEKNLLERDTSKMKHIYHAVAEEKTKKHLLNKFVERMYNGSTGNLIMQLLGNKQTSKEELKQIKDLLDEMDDD